MHKWNTFFIIIFSRIKTENFWLDNGLKKIDTLQRFVMQTQVTSENNLVVGDDASEKEIMYWRKVCEELNGQNERQQRELQTKVRKFCQLAATDSSSLLAQGTLITTHVVVLIVMLKIIWIVPKARYLTS